MKIAARILSVIALISVATMYTACGPDDPKEKSEIDQQIELLNGNWTVTSATFNDLEPDLDHDGMTMEITGTIGNETISYNVDNRPTGPSAWPATGSFTFNADPKTSLTRDDGVTVSYSVTATQLNMSFNFDKDPYTAGRVSSVRGEWKFVFTKN